MGLNFTAYSIPLFAGAVLISIVALFILRQKLSLTARYMAATNFLIATYVFCYGMELSQTSIQGALVWAKVEYLAVTPTPVTLIFVALAFTGYQRWLTNMVKSILMFIPALTILFAWTNELHQWIWQNPRLVPAGRLLFFDFSPGGWYWVNVLYIYLSIVTCAVMLIRHYRNAPDVHRAQIRLIMLGLAIPVMAHLIYLAAVMARLPILMINWQAYAFIILALLTSLGVTNFQLLEIMPVARDAIFENMEDGAIVLDYKNRVADLNPSAQSIFGWDRASIIGKPIADMAIPGNHGHPFETVDPPGNKAEILVGKRAFEMSISPFEGSGRQPNGRLIVLRDITSRKQAEDHLSQAHTHLQQQYARIQDLQAQLQKQALLDPLTGLFNRRYLEDVLVQEVDTAEREGSPLSVAIIDIDHYKDINDRYGHSAGDQMLQALGKLLRSKIRKEDAACRFGGDEFVIVLPGAEIATGMERAETIRSAFEALTIDHDGDQMSATLSVGIAAYPIHGKTSEALIRAADHSLYNAKLAGRNRIVVCGGEKTSTAKSI